MIIYRLFYYTLENNMQFTFARPLGYGALLVWFNQSLYDTYINGINFKQFLYTKTIQNLLSGNIASYKSLVKYTLL